MINKIQIHAEDKEFFRTHGLLLATHNKGKAAEIIRHLIFNPAIHLYMASDFNLQAPHEPYLTFEENAAWKAQHASEQTGLACLADDSGLILPSLGGAPGVHTADWFTNAQGQRCFDTGFNKLNEALTGKERTAYLFALLALSFPSGRTYFFKEQLEGLLLSSPRGEHGFGFDPIFQPKGAELSLAQMNQEQREKYSARSRAAFQCALALQ